jgi:Flp pilus assembly protein TadG
MPKRGRERRRDRESGVTVVEFVLLSPILFILMFGTVELGLVTYAHHAAVAAAEQGARTGREDVSTDPDGWQPLAQDKATNWVSSLVGGLVEQGSLTAHATSDPLTKQYPEVTVRVNFNMVSVVPWVVSLSATSAGPVECFYTPGGTCDGG